MNEHESVRRALDDLIGVPPLSLGRRGAVMQRIAKVNHRRRVASQAAMSAFVVVAATYGGVQMITATPASNDRLVEAPSESPSYEPTAKPTPSATKKKVEAPKPKPTVQPTAAPTKTTTKPVYEPKPSYEPKPTYTKPPTTGALSVELYPYTEAKAGAEMQWKVKAYDPDGRLLKVVLYFGDGSSTSSGAEGPCGEGVAVKKFFPHTYAKAGTFSAKAVVTTGECGAATETKTAYASVKVYAAGTGNGPAAPTVTVEQVEGALLALHGTDADGWVKKFYVDWGDGSESYAGPRPFDGCQDGKPSSWDTTASHDYAAPGTYTVTVTVLSTNCDAGQGQTKSVTLSITV